MLETLERLDALRRQLDTLDKQGSTWTQDLPLLAQGGLMRSSNGAEPPQLDGLENVLCWTFVEFEPGGYPNTIWALSREQRDIIWAALQT